jgi:hypothetical protein
MTKLFQQELSVVNVGLRQFVDPIRLTGAKAVHLDWAPPGQGDRAIGDALARLIAEPRVEAANAKAYARYLAATPVLEGIGRARDVLPRMGRRMLLHAGPPIEWARMCGPMQGAIVGAILFEGWAGDARAARALARSGAIRFAPCHQHAAVGPMAGIISPSMPVWIVRDSVHRNRAFSTFNEGLGKVLRFGAYSPEVISRLNWIRDVLAPAIVSGLKQLGPLELKPLMAQALHMGDEVHNRNSAASALMIKRLLPALLRSGVSVTTIAAVCDFMGGNDHFFLNLSMAACKVMLDAAAGVPRSSMVTAMCRNGVQFGIRLAGTGDTWFSAPAPVVDGLYFPGYSKADAAGDLGDSAITETAGLGGFAMAAAPAIVQFIGGTADDARAHSLEMSHITLGRNVAFTLPVLNFAGTPAGIDARKVVDTGIAPVINTGIAHRAAGIGQIGAGVTRAPLVCFGKALVALAGSLERKSHR